MGSDESQRVKEARLKKQLTAPSLHKSRSTETVRLAQDGHLDFHTAPELCLHLSSMLLYVHRTIRIVRDGESGTATSTFTQLLSWAGGKGYCGFSASLQEIKRPFVKDFSGEKVGAKNIKR